MVSQAAREVFRIALSRSRKQAAYVREESLSVANELSSLVRYADSGLAIVPSGRDG